MVASRFRTGPGRRRFDVQLNAKARASRSRWGYRLGAVLLLLAVLSALALVVIAGIRITGKMLFSGQDRFRIQTIEIVDGRIKTADMIREYLDYEGITAGTNLFAFDIGELVRRYLERNPLVRTMRVRRRLPDTLVVEIYERAPLVRIGQRGTLVADREGFIFRLNRDLHRLPVVVGFRGPELAPGDTVQGMLRAAVDVLAACDNPRLGLRLVGVDAGHDDYLRLHVLTADGIKEAKLAWEGMGQGGEASRDRLLMRLSELRQVLREDRAGHTEYNVTIPGRVFAR